MQYWKAEATLKAIDDAVCADGGNTFRKFLGQVMPHMHDAYREGEDDYRTHLGASVIGGKCERAVFYGHRWASQSKIRGKKGEPSAKAESRMRRLWNRGHMEEGRFIAMLLAAGVQVLQQDSEGKQFRISAHGGHFGGSGDGILIGVPDLPHGVPALGEFKTHSAKSFKELVDFGVREAKPEHYVQMQEYMHHFGLLYALYLAVNKDTDELHAEIVMYDQQTANDFLKRAARILFNPEPPDRIRGGNPAYHVCKYLCDHTDVCFSTVKPQRNCRTCDNIRFREDGTVRCGLVETFPATANDVLDKAAQIRGCEQYKVNPEL